MVHFSESGSFAKSNYYCTLQNSNASSNTLSGNSVDQGFNFLQRRFRQQAVGIFFHIADQ